MPGTNARTSRWAPSRLRSSSRAKRSVSTSWMVPGATRPALETTTSTSPRSRRDGAAANAVDGVVVGQVERVDDRLAARARGSAPRPPRTCRYAGRRARPGGRRRPRASAVAAPMPDEAPVTTAGRRSGWSVLAHQRSLHRDRAAGRSRARWRSGTGRPGRGRPRRRRCGGPARSRATRASSRARLAPRQKCRPPPKLRIWRSSAVSRCTSKLVRVGEDAVVAVGGAEHDQQLRARRGAVRRAGSTSSSRCGRAAGWRCRSAASPRSSGSTRLRSAKTSSRWSGCAVRWNIALPSSLVVVSLPATTIRKRKRDDLLVGHPVAVDPRRRAARW